jgi:phytoene synthase
VAFQLTNFIRDIGEDYRRGRIYLPLHSLAEHDVTPAMLGAQTSTPQLQSLIAAEIERARSFYRRAAPGIEMLHPSSRDCVRTAAVLYSDILTEIERNEYRVLEKRAVVKRSRRLIIGAKGYLRALRAR